MAGGESIKDIIQRSYRHALNNAVIVVAIIDTVNIDYVHVECIRILRRFDPFEIKIYGGIIDIADAV